MEWFRQEIRRVYGGRVPKVLDPFSGGGAIPMEVMRLGCEATAVDINPVAWFVLKCTLEYPQRYAGKRFPLPEFILENDEFMEAFYKANSHLVGRTKRTKKQAQAPGFFDSAESGRAPAADLAWQVRAWGRWVLDQARKELSVFYPTYADFEPLPKFVANPYEKRPIHLVPTKKDGTPDPAALNREFSKEYLADSRNPRWITKPTVAYLWARQVVCKNCRAALPLLKTRWLCKKDKKRILLTMKPNRQNNGVVFDIEQNVPAKGGNAAQKREYDKKLGAGTMSRSGAKCPCCGAIMTMEDIRLEGKAGRLGAVMTSVVVESGKGKQYRLPTEEERTQAAAAEKMLAKVFAEVPFGMPMENVPKGGGGASRAFSLVGYGFNQWHSLFARRQLLALGVFVKCLRETVHGKNGIPEELREPVAGYLALLVDKVADYNSMVCTWHNSRELIGHTFARFALPITWDFSELAVINDVGGAWQAQLDWIARFLDHALVAAAQSPKPTVTNISSIKLELSDLDAIITDPPYYDAIPYSDAMDFCYIWLRRCLTGLTPEIDASYSQPLSPKWNHEDNDGELIDDSSRHNGDGNKSKATYEDGMYRVFVRCHEALKPEGRLVVVFAHKHPIDLRISNGYICHRRHGSSEA